MNTTSKSRRGFMKTFALGAGSLVIGVTLGDRKVLHAQEVADETSFVPSLWLEIEQNGQVRIWTHRSEMGTGIRTSLPMIVADELCADWDKVSLVQAIGDPAYGDQNTDGSRSVRQFYEVMRSAGASARLMLERSAAAIWSVDPSRCHAIDHEVKGPKGLRISFGALVKRAREQAVPEAKELNFKKPEERRYVGKEEVRFHDVQDVVTGAASFGADVKVPNAVTAVIWRTPTLHGTIKSFDADAALKVPGVIKVLELPKFQGTAPSFQALGGIAVIAENTWSAIRGRMFLKVDWEPGKDADFQSSALMDEMEVSSNKDARVIRESGNVQTAMDQAVTLHKADYRVPFLAHAPMEPPVAIAIVKEGTCEAWAPTQNPQAARGTIAQVLKLSPDKVVVNVTMLGGGFGRKSKPDFIVEAAMLSKMLNGQAVRVQWTREDDIRWDYYHTAACVHMEAGLNDKGMPAAWLQRSTFPTILSTFNAAAKDGSELELGLGFTDVPYQIEHLRAENGQAQAPTRIGWLRSVAHVYHAFADCSFIDELGVLSGNDDAFDFISKALGPDRKIDLTPSLAKGFSYPNHGESLDRYPIDTGRMRRVLKHVCDVAELKKRNKTPNGKGMGIAVHRSFLSYCAVVVRAAVSKDGKVEFPQVDIALDCGLIVNPDRVRAQLEGAVVFGHAIAMMGEISIRNGRTLQENFHDYRVSRMHEAPLDIRTHLLQNEALPAGVGEVGVPPIAPAICNAIFDACGKRVRDLPISKHDLSWA